MFWSRVPQSPRRPLWSFLYIVGILLLAHPAGTTPIGAVEPLPLELSVTPLATQTRAGVPIELEVRLRVQPGTQVEPIDFSQQLGEWQVFEQTESKPLPGSTEQRWHLSIATFQTGEVPVPALVVKFKLPKGKPGEFRSLPVTVRVAPLPKKNGDQAGLPRGLKPLWGMISWWPWILFLVGLALALSALVWYERRHAAARSLEPTRPARPPEVVARERLAQLRASGLVGQGAWKAFYSELSDILRRYLEGRFQLPATDRTTYELMHELRSTAAKRQDLAVVREVLESSDLVKFAKDRPTALQAESELIAVAELVDRTTFAPAEPEGSEAQA